MQLIHQNGEIIEQGDTLKVIGELSSPYTAAHIAAIPEDD